MPAPKKNMEETLAELVAELDGRIGSATANVEKAQAELSDLERRREVLNTALYEIQRGPEPRAKAGDRPWAKLNRNDAVERVLKEADRLLSPLEISQALAERGRGGDDPGAVSAALNYLAKKRRVSRHGPGRWQAGPSELNTPDLTTGLDHPVDRGGLTSPPALDEPASTEASALAYYEEMDDINRVLETRYSQGEGKVGATSEAPGPGPAPR
jgi:hypothetical protein